MLDGKGRGKSEVDLYFRYLTRINLSQNVIAISQNKNGSKIQELHRSAPTSLYFFVPRRAERVKCSSIVNISSGGMNGRGGEESLFAPSQVQNFLPFHNLGLKKVCGNDKI